MRQLSTIVWWIIWLLIVLSYRNEKRIDNLQQTMEDRDWCIQSYTACVYYKDHTECIVDLHKCNSIAGTKDFYTRQ